MKTVFYTIMAVFFWNIIGVLPSISQDFTALARYNPVGSSIRMAGRDLTIELSLSQPVPYRVFTLTDPPRLVADFKEIQWGEANSAGILTQGAAKNVRFGRYQDSWSRMVVDLNGPMTIRLVQMQTNVNSGAATARITLEKATFAAFTAHSGAPDDKAPARIISRKPVPRKRLVVVLDPGHGGLDPGAERDGVSEAKLMLGFARSLKDELIKSGAFDVVLTRDKDEFIPLETRVSLARAASADVFISLHADILESGGAAGATVYVLAEKSSDRATEILVERHKRDDILGGIDLAQQGDEIATVLIDLARVETAPRSEKLAKELVEGLRASIGRMHRKPLQSGGFAVLKAADFPSVLIELGFMSDDADFLNLGSQVWRARAALGIRIALEHWASSDEQLRKRMRQ